MFVLTGYWGRDYIKGKTKKKGFLSPYNSQSLTVVSQFTQNNAGI